MTSDTCLKQLNQHCYAFNHRIPQTWCDSLLTLYVIKEEEKLRNLLKIRPLPESLTGSGHSGPQAYEAVRALDTSEAASRGYVANNNKTAGGVSKKHSKT